MLAGILWGIAACALWGMVYIVPLLLSDFDPLLIALARYLIFGAASTVLLAKWARRFHELTPRDAWEAFLIGAVGNLFFYWLLASCVQLSGAPVAGAFTAVIPISVALVANHAAKKVGRAVPWRSLMLPLALIAVGMSCLNATELITLTKAGVTEPGRFWLGVAFGAASLVVWTWYPIANAQWLLAHRRFSPAFWTAAQGAGVFPAAAIGFLIYAAALPDGQSLISHDPIRFWAGTAFLAIFCSLTAIVFWNKMSQRLPPALSGQMIIFETIFAVFYAHILRKAWPTWLMALGLLLLLAGVVAAAQVFRIHERRAAAGASGADCRSGP